MPGNMSTCIDQMPDDTLSYIFGFVMEHVQTEAGDAGDGKGELRVWCDLSAVCSRWQRLMLRQPISVWLDDRECKPFCRWAGEPGCRPPIRRIGMCSPPLGRPRPYQKRRAQLTRLLHSPHFQARSGSSLTDIASRAGADFDGVEHVFTNLKTLELGGPLPPAPLPRGLTFLRIRGSEATANEEEELRLLLVETASQRQQGQPILPALGPELQQHTQLLDLSLMHFHLPRDTGDLLPASVQYVMLKRCTVTAAFPPKGWGFHSNYVPPWDFPSLLVLACNMEDDVHAVEAGSMWRRSS